MTCSFVERSSCTVGFVVSREEMRGDFRVTRPHKNAPIMNCSSGSELRNQNIYLSQLWFHMSVVISLLVCSVRGSGATAATAAIHPRLVCRFLVVVLTAARTRLLAQSFPLWGSWWITANPETIPLGRITLGPYRKCPGVKRPRGAPRRSAGRFR